MIVKKLTNDAQCGFRETETVVVYVACRIQAFEFGT